MLDKLKSFKTKYLELQEQLKQEEVMSDPKLFGKLNKEFQQSSKMYSLIVEYEKSLKEVEDLKKILKGNDKELIIMAKEELPFFEKKIEDLEQEIKIQLLPKDPNDERNIILEIRSGAGGDEASLFVQEIFEAYSYYAQKKNWKVDVISISDGNVGGYKEVIASVSGDKVYSFLKYESGVHRVQRVPKTESQGRVHTSTITVAMLPEADPVDVKINPTDLRIDVCRASGAGGQHVNTTDSAVRIVHLPTKIMVYCQQEKSQHANKEKALKNLYARLLDFQQKQIKEKESKQRQEQIGTGDRSQRIRTYNFPQSRLTDHRIPLTVKNLASIMGGDFDHVISSLNTHYQSMALEDKSKS
ncbi:MAG: peptide chain release factor 1 [Bdellovibrionales bacterium]